MDKKAVLERYLAGKSTPEETTQVTAWLADDQADLSLVKEVISSYQENSNNTGNIQQRDQLLLQLRQQLYPHLTAELDYQLNGSTEAAPVIALPSRQRKSWIGAAAAIAVVLAGIFLLRNTTQHSPAISLQSLNNTTSQVQLYRLPDSSRVWLQPHSRLQYAAGFEQVTTRAVQLEGEGFFEIAPDAKRPFLVQSGGILTKVLGTAFNLEAYAQEQMVRVSLLQGKVAVEDTTTGHSTLLLPGHQLVYRKEQHSPKMDTLANTDLHQWTNGTIVLNNMPVADALQRMAHRYGLQLIYAAGVHLKGKNVNGVFKEQSLDEMLRIILFVSGYQYKLTAQTIEIYKK
jgi:ferric-dicitrate binding protein FerR (iron transport regulator)